MIVDSHVHAFSSGYFPPEWYDARADDWANRKFPARSPNEIREGIDSSLEDPLAQSLVADMNAAGIDRAVCIGLDPWFALSPEPADGAEHVRAQRSIVQGAGGRLSGFVGLDPRRTNAVQLLKWAIEDMGFQGLKLYPPHGYYPHDDVCLPLWKYCENRGVPVMVHTALVKYPLQSRFANPLHLQDVQKAFPNIRLILAHAGYPTWWREAALVVEGHPTSYLDVSNWNKEFKADPKLVTRRLTFWRDAVGAHRMMFGSDHFTGSKRKRTAALKDWLDFLQSSVTWEEDERELFFGGNIIRNLHVHQNPGQQVAT